MLIKVCCVQNETEMRAAANAGATHVGLVGAMPSGPGPIPDREIRRLAAIAPQGLRAVLLTSRTEAAGIIEHVTSTGVDSVQVVSQVGVDVLRAVRAGLPRIEMVQVVHVEGPEALEVASGLAGVADYVLLDSGRPSAATPELGGTGRTHDWRVSQRIVERLGVPVFLAGGLGPTNVGRAIQAVRPAGVDVCSGLRDEGGRLDPISLAAFVRAARAA